MDSYSATTRTATPLLTPPSLDICPTMNTAPTTITTTSAIFEGFESLDKWKNDCRSTENTSTVNTTNILQRFLYQHNRHQAAGSGFPLVLEVGRARGLTDHEVAAIFGWTTGDYRFVNPIARGELSMVTFSDYPFLPQQMTKVYFSLTRDNVLPYVYILSAALSKLPREESGEHRLLWRGHRRQVQSNKEDDNGNDNGNNNSNIMIGGRFLLKGFTSATRDRENALDFCAKIDDGGNDDESSKERTLLAIVQSKSGRCISKFSARSEEMEVLFPLDTMFEVVEPPTDLVEEDLKAIQPVLAKLRRNVAGAEIDLVYVKEIETTEWG